MARQPRFFVPGEVLRAIQRGNNREPIFAVTSSMIGWTSLVYGVDSLSTKVLDGVLDIPHETAHHFFVRDCDKTRMSFFVTTAGNAIR